MSSPFLLQSCSFSSVMVCICNVCLFDSPQCFDCQASLGGSEAGAEVRIRNKQLYCNLCYMRFKSEYSINATSTVCFSRCDVTVCSGSAATPTAMWPVSTPPDRWRNYLWQQPMNPFMKLTHWWEMYFCFFVIEGLRLRFIVFIITYEVLHVTGFLFYTFKT